MTFPSPRFQSFTSFCRLFFMTSRGQHSKTSFNLNLAITFHFLWLSNFCLLFPSFQMWFMTFRPYEVWLRAQINLSKKIKENKFVFAIHLKLHFQYTAEPWISRLMRTGLKSCYNREFGSSRVLIIKNMNIIEPKTKIIWISWKA